MILKYVCITIDFTSESYRKIKFADNTFKKSPCISHLDLQKYRWIKADPAAAAISGVHCNEFIQFTGDGNATGLNYIFDGNYGPDVATAPEFIRISTGSILIPSTVEVVLHRSLNDTYHRDQLANVTVKIGNDNNLLDNSVCGSTGSAPSNWTYFVMRCSSSISGKYIFLINEDDSPLRLTEVDIKMDTNANSPSPVLKDCSELYKFGIKDPGRYYVDLDRDGILSADEKVDRYDSIY